MFNEDEWNLTGEIRERRTIFGNYVIEVEESNRRKFEPLAVGHSGYVTLNWCPVKRFRRARLVDIRAITVMKADRLNKAMATAC